MKLYKLKDVAAYIGVTPNTVRNWQKQGKIHGLRLADSGRYWFSQEEVDRVYRQFYGIKED
ncbi:helix-turn-helix domain-containing protein [Alicyclobacillus tolerans]|uniref:helix-turn-helix domain-containing protein n=1 Tax=Alicyclobacillus tolerans TaxID=90970 RepID=UPI001F3B2DD0|nr:helix-turn-helix domain-containing protein [Alicyclobacillus tolerans]MCF8567023.1 helix-turn-helix domain-containing protein [Alicyclobacillus tolerans]